MTWKWFRKQGEESGPPAAPVIKSGAKELVDIYEKIAKLLENPLYYIGEDHKIIPIKPVEYGPRSFTLRFCFDYNSGQPLLKTEEISDYDYFSTAPQRKSYKIEDLYLTAEEAIDEIKKRCDINEKKLRDKFHLP